MDHAGLLRNLRNLLSGVLTLHRHGHCLAGSGLLSVIFPAVPATVRSPVGCVGENCRPRCDICATGPGRHAGSGTPISSRDKSAVVHIATGSVEPAGALALRATGITTTTSILKTSANDNYAKDQSADRGYWRIRLTFVLGATVTLFVLRIVDPMVAGSWVPLHTSCGAITGLPCIFCGMTRALHLLLNGDFRGALYFNWLAFPFVGAIVFLVAVFVVEIANCRIILTWNASAPLTARKLTIIGLSLLMLWTVQAYLAVSQHKHELLNPRGPLYALFVR